MGKSERERRHQAALEGIDRVYLVVGRGDRLRIDHEGTLLERARLLGEEIGAHEASERGLQAFDRLLRLACEPGLRERQVVLEFLAAVRSNQPLALGTLRGLDAAIGDDMLAVLDAFRHARLDLVEEVEGGPRRVARVLRGASLAGA